MGDPSEGPRSGAVLVLLGVHRGSRNILYRDYIGMVFPGCLLTTSKQFVRLSSFHSFYEVSFGFYCRRGWS